MKKSSGSASHALVSFASVAGTASLHPYTARSFLTVVGDPFTLAFIAFAWFTPLSGSNVSSFDSLTISSACTLSADGETLFRSKETFFTAVS